MEREVRVVGTDRAFKGGEPLFLRKRWFEGGVSVPCVCV